MKRKVAYRKWITAIGSHHPVASLIGRNRFIARLWRRVRRNKEQLRKLSPKAAKAFIEQQAATIATAAKRIIYEPAILEANLPPELLSEIRDRCWKRIDKFDPARGTLVDYIRGFIRCTTFESRRNDNSGGIVRQTNPSQDDATQHKPRARGPRTPRVQSIDQPDNRIDIEDPGRNDTAEAVIAPEDDTSERIAKILPTPCALKPQGPRTPEFVDEDMKRVFDGMQAEYLDPCDTMATHRTNKRRRRRPSWSKRRRHRGFGCVEG
jgi:hypothetical protein